MDQGRLAGEYRMDLVGSGQGSLAGSCKHNNESSSSGAKELVGFRDYVCVCGVTEKRVYTTAVTSLSSNNQLIFVMETCCVLFEVESLCKISIFFRSASAS
jgi:hypothetical protein